MLRRSWLTLLFAVVMGCAQGRPVDPDLGSAEGAGPDAATPTCVCSAGECCDGCNLLGPSVECGADVEAVETQCDSAQCGADALVREQRRHCDSVNADCGDGNLVWTDWQVLEDCGDDALCASDGTDASCSTCVSGCSQGSCVCGQGTNVAPTATASLSRGSSDQTTYGPHKMNDGQPETSCGFAWFYDEAPDVGWIELSWAAPVDLWGFTIDTVNAASAPCQYTPNRTLAGGAVEWWDGSGWVADGTVSGQTGDWTYEFAAPITTTRLRVNNAYASPSVNPAVFEWLAFECSGS